MDSESDKDYCPAVGEVFEARIDREWRLARCFKHNKRGEPEFKVEGMVGTFKDKPMRPLAKSGDKRVQPNATAHQAALGGNQAKKKTTRALRKKTPMRRTRKKIADDDEDGKMTGSSGAGDADCPTEDNDDDHDARQEMCLSTQTTPTATPMAQEDGEGEEEEEGEPDDYYENHDYNATINEDDMMGYNGTNFRDDDNEHSRYPGRPLTPDTKSRDHAEDNRDDDASPDDDGVEEHLCTEDFSYCSQNDDIINPGEVQHEPGDVQVEEMDDDGDQKDQGLDGVAPANESKSTPVKDCLRTNVESAVRTNETEVAAHYKEQYEEKLRKANAKIAKQQDLIETLRAKSIELNLYKQLVHDLRRDKDRLETEKRQKDEEIIRSTVDRMLFEQKCQSLRAENERLEKDDIDNSVRPGRAGENVLEEKLKRFFGLMGHIEDVSHQRGNCDLKFTLDKTSWSLERDVFILMRSKDSKKKPTTLLPKADRLKFEKDFKESDAACGFLYGTKKIFASEPLRVDRSGRMVYLGGDNSDQSFVHAFISCIIIAVNAGFKEIVGNVLEKVGVRMLEHNELVEEKVKTMQDHQDTMRTAFLEDLEHLGDHAGEINTRVINMLSDSRRKRRRRSRAGANGRTKRPAAAASTA
uniref:Uncharacterized protein n=1 Tax=Lotharella globosa TaxID=91324 RepID=A0A7S4DVN9_9EUKA